MPVEVAMNTPLAEALQHEVQGKLVENGWAPGDSSDTTMAEYLILMVVNGKLEDEIAVELASDLLNLSPEDNSAREFSRWLFATIEAQHARLNGPPQQTQQQQQHQHQAAHQHGGAGGGNDDDDMDMDLSTENAGDIVAPTGPKALRNGAGAGNFRGGRDKRMLGQVNRQMDRTNNDAVLHRIRGQGGQSDRINSHTRGGGGINGRGGAGGFGNGNGMGNGRQPRHMNNGTQARFNHALANMGAGGMPNTWMGPAGGGPQPGQPPMQPGPMDVYAMLEQQSRMMQQMQQQMQQQQQLMQNNQNRRGGGMNNRGGRSLGDRGGRGGGSNNSYNSHNNNNNNHNNKPRNSGHDDIVLGDLGDLDDVLQKHNGAAGEGSTTGGGGVGSGDSDMDMALGDPRLNGGSGSGSTGGGIAETVCKFNLHCANKDCKFAHQSPAAPPGTTVNVHEVCSFAAACKNKKCTSRHPSPAARAAHQSEMDCKFYPNCTNPHCPFRHPSMPLCRNGGDCTVRGCKFTHVQTMCKFRPCTNRFCTFKHEEGQRGVFPDKVWTAAEGGKAENGGDNSSSTHISERKFVDESAPEETILPDADNKDAAAKEPEIA